VKKLKLKTTEIFNKAYTKYGIAAFNVFNAEQVHGVFKGASEVGVPVIVQITPVARDYMSPNFLEGIINAAGSVYEKAVYSVHLDHGNVEHCINSINSGFYNSVMIDASHEDFEKNIEITNEIVKRAHDKDITVEAELGVLSGVEDDIKIGAEKARYTDPDQAVEFVKRTNCDSLAVAAGTSHGAYKFKGSAGLNLEILKRIQALLPGYPLVLHGASGVPQDEVLRINKAGGKLQEAAKGINYDDLLCAIQSGVTKINIATDMRLIWTRVHREFFINTPELFDPVIPGRKYMEELKEFVKQKCQSLIISKQ
jgi:fructose-bisphosphate aldolase, class II